MSQQRQFVINLKQSGTNKTATVTVVQEGFTPVYTFKVDGSSSVNFTSGGGSKTVDIISSVTTPNSFNSVDYTITSQNGVTATKTSGGIKITAASNSTFDSKSGTVTLKQNGSGKTITINVTIAAKADENIFYADPDRLSFGAEAGSKKTTITSTHNGSHANWTVTNRGSLPSWITITGDNSSPMTVTVKENN